MSSSLMLGPPAGFLSRVTGLEREVSFLKQKVEDDARWKHVLEKWILDNFAFDIRGALLAKERGGFRTAMKKTGGVRGSKLKGGGGHEGSSSKVKYEERSRRSSSQIKKSLSESAAEGDEDEDEGMYGNNEGMEVNVDPRDLIILPDCPSGSEEGEGGRRQGFKNDYDSDYDGMDSGQSGISGGESGGGESESESEEETPKKNKKMEWSLQSSYPNLENLKQNFNMRDWALWTTSRTAEATKIYYYCKGCRKFGPCRLMIKFRTEDTEVEMYRNEGEHDHSKKNRITEEVRSEIFNLYKAGMKNSTQIIAAFKISKPDLRVPSPKQVCYVLKAQKKQERKEKKLLQGNAEEKKPKIKKGKKSSLPLIPEFQRSTSSISASQNSQHFSSANNNSEQFQGPLGHHQPAPSPHNIVSGGGGAFNTPTLQAFSSSVYQQIQSQHQQGSYDPTTPLHLQHQQFHSL